MRLPVGPALLEARGIVVALREGVGEMSVGAILVSGMLAEQLGRELGSGAKPGAVFAGDVTHVPRAEVVVHVIAGEPSDADDELVMVADRHGVPVVLVQLWPQADWGRPYVLTPFVVECETGKGFPISEIARRIVEAVEDSVALARRAPVLEGAVTRAVVGTSAVRAAVTAALGSRSAGTRPLLVLEQVRMLAELRALEDRSEGRDVLAPLAGIAAATVGASFAFRTAARKAGRVLPAPLVNAAVAAAGTWALGEAFRRLEQREA
jgi:hypothetical protein